MKHYLNKFFFLLYFVVTTIYASPAPPQSDPSDVVRAGLVREKNIADLLVKETKKIAPSDSDIEFKQILEVKHPGSYFRYIVPVRANSGENRGCYLYNFDQKIQTSQKVLLSKLDEAESCEIIAAVFSCNRERKSTSGIGVLYGKRLGADNYWFEGSYLSIDQNGILNEDKDLSARLTDVETVSMARKKIGCH